MSLQAATRPAAETLTAAAAEGGVQSGAWLLVAMPLLGAAILLIGGRRTDKWGHWLAVALSWGAFVWGALLFLDLKSLDPEERAVGVHLFSWVPAGTFQLDAGLLI